MSEVLNLYVWISDRFVVICARSTLGDAAFPVTGPVIESDKSRAVVALDGSPASDR